VFLYEILLTPNFRREFRCIPCQNFWLYSFHTWWVNKIRFHSNEVIVRSSRQCRVPLRVCTSSCVVWISGCLTKRSPGRIWWRRRVARTLPWTAAASSWTPGTSPTNCLRNTHPSCFQFWTTSSSICCRIELKSVHSNNSHWSRIGVLRSSWCSWRSPTGIQSQSRFWGWWLLEWKCRRFPRYWWTLRKLESSVCSLCTREQTSSWFRRAWGCLWSAWSLCSTKWSPDGWGGQRPKCEHCGNCCCSFIPQIRLCAPCRSNLIVCFASHQYYCFNYSIIVNMSFTHLFHM